MAADLRQIAAAVREQWSYLEHRGLDLDAQLAASLRELPGVRTAGDFAQILRRFVAAMQDGHAWSHVSGAGVSPRLHLPFTVVDCREGLVVGGVPPDAEAPRRGDLLLAIDGVPVAERLAAIEAETSASTPGMRRRLAIAALLRTTERTVRVRLQRRNGESYEIELATSPEQPDPPDLLRREENWSLTWPRERIARLHLHSFAVPRWQEWLRAKPEERDPFLAEGRARVDQIVAELRERGAEALILDLRGNGGGTDLLGIHLAERLLADPFVYFQLSARFDGAWTRPNGYVYGKGGHARFAGRIVALVDSGCFSTTDNFLRCLDDCHPALTVIGRPTGAGTGAPRELVTAEHSKAKLGACTQRVYGPAGKLIEGIGTQPDVAVIWTRDDVSAGRDPDLAAAFEVVERAR